MAEIHAFWRNCIGGKRGDGGAPVQLFERGKPWWELRIAAEGAARRLGYFGSRTELARKRPTPRARVHIRE